MTITINPDFTGLPENHVQLLQGFVPPITMFVNRLSELNDVLDAGTERATKRQLTQEAISAVPADFAPHVVRQIQQVAGEDPLKLLGLVKAVEAALNNAFGEQNKSFVNERVEALTGENEGPKLSDDERKAAVEEYVNVKAQLDLMLKMLTNNTPGGERLAAKVPAFQNKRTSSGPRAASGPRIKGFQFVLGSTVVADSFPNLAKYISKEAGEGNEITTLHLKEAVARDNNVDPSDDEAFKALFKELAGRDSFRVPVSDKDGNQVVFVARKADASTVSSDASDDEADEDDDQE